MTADESGQLSGLTSEVPSSSNASTSQDGDSQQQPDIDTRPVGRCYNEAKRLKNLVAQAKAVDAAMRDALTAFWACRDAASAEAHAARQEPFTMPLASAQAQEAQTVFDTREYYLRWIERQLETRE